MVRFVASASALVPFGSTSPIAASTPSARQMSVTLLSASPPSAASSDPSCCSRLSGAESPSRVVEASLPALPAAESPASGAESRPPTPFAPARPLVPPVCEDESGVKAFSCTGKHFTSKDSRNPQSKTGPGRMGCSTIVDGRIRAN